VAVATRIAETMKAALLLFDSLTVADWGTLLQRCTWREAVNPNESRIPDRV